MSKRCWAYVGAGTLALIVYLALPAGLPRDAVYSLVGVSCVVAILVGVRVNRPAHSLPWLLMAAGQACWVVADLTYDWYDDVRDEVPFPSAADGFYLVAYPLLGLGIGVLVHRRVRDHDVVGTIDTLIVSVAFALVSWVVIAGPVVDSSSGDTLERVIAVAYPVGDVALLAVLMRLVTSSGARTRAFQLLVPAVVALVLADTGFAASASIGQYDSTLDLLWMASYVLWGAAALHPTMTTLSDHATVRTSPFTSHRLAAMTVAVLVAPAVLAVQLTLGTAIDGWAVVVGSVALFLLVLARMRYAIEEMQNATEQRDVLQGDLFRQAAHDSLTGLANRSYILQQIDDALHRGRRAGSVTALLFVDLDHFKAVNDTMGHRAGDQVLVAVAERMRRAVGEAGTVGRLGGDEFLVLLEGLDGEGDAVEMAQRLLETVKEPLIVSGRRAPIGSSIGVALSIDARTDANELLHEADIANNRAKVNGRGRAELFDEVLRDELEEQADLEAALTAGLRNGEFVLHYQPVVAIHTAVVDGYEALIRWNRPGHGLVPPDDFVPFAERSDLICELDRWVLREATAQLAAWTRQDPQHFKDLTVAVNISGRHLATGDVVADVSAALDAAGLPPERLSLEITETVLVTVPTAVAQLGALQELGVSISIDDFGTGYTSIAQLQHLPVDALKIDKSFITSDAPGSQELVMLMANAAHGCGLLVVAEGVEDSGHLDALMTVPLDGVQGFLFARPVPADEVVPSDGRPHLVAVRDVDES